MGRQLPVTPNARVEGIRATRSIHHAGGESLMELSGYIAILTGLIAARIINERGYRTLSDEQKVRLMDGFSAQRVYALILLLVLIGGYFFLIRAGIDPTLLSAGYFSLLAAYIIVLAVWNHWRLKALGMPDTYRRFFTASQAVSMLGVAWFFFTLFY
ncbi:MAG TPA: hypothetical protein VMP01_10805 [Pirellulaceae bacterium]|nr:hypothetical protein [Pirellulaceae bacterium]